MIDAMPEQRIDAHVHVVDFCQEGPGLGVLIEHLDLASIDGAVVFGVPVTKEWSESEPHAAGYYLDDMAPCYPDLSTDDALAHEHAMLDPSDAARLAPLACGFNPVDRRAARQLERVLDRHPGVFRGVGEVFCRHDELSALIRGQRARPDHPGLLDVLRVAQERELPVLVHQNAASPSPDDGVGHYLPELRRALESTSATVVWAHAGVSHTAKVPDHAQLIERLLDEYGHLVVDLSWALLERELDAGGRLSDEWAEVLERRSDRFCLGSDVLGSFEGVERRLRSYDPVLERLSESARADLIGRTARRVYFREGETGGSGSGAATRTRGFR